jgi:AhpD family alkylhydroperoxidase
MVQSELPISVLFNHQGGHIFPENKPDRAAMQSRGAARNLLRKYQVAQRMGYEAATPAGVKVLAGVYSYVFQSGLPKALLDLVYLRVSQINGCAYMDTHSRELLKAGVMDEKLALLPTWREGRCMFDESERAARSLGRRR